MFHDQVIHCDPGVNVVRAYPMEKVGAGYRARSSTCSRGPATTGFARRSVVAPDGSLIVADWYDPGVGGHRMGDITHGRIFRVAPPHTPYRAPHVDYSSIPGAIEALKSPNLATRYLAWTALAARGTAAEPALTDLFEHAANPRIRARALWLLGAVSRHAGNLRGQGGRRLEPRPPRNGNPSRTKVADGTCQNRRQPGSRPDSGGPPRMRDRRAEPRGPRKSAPWVELAAQYDGHDRWYLEALGIGADGDWDACLAAWLNKVGSNWKSQASRDIVWRSRAAKTPQLLAELIEDPATPAAELPRYLRAFDFLTGPEKERRPGRPGLRCTDHSGRAPGTDGNP